MYRWVGIQRRQTKESIKESRCYRAFTFCIWIPIHLSPSGLPSPHHQSVNQNNQTSLFILQPKKTPRLQPPNQLTSSTALLPPNGLVPPNALPAGPLNHSPGTPTRHPSASLIHRTYTGFAGAISSSGGEAESSPRSWAEISAAEILPRRFGACFLRRRLIVSICWVGKGMSEKFGWEEREIGERRFEKGFEKGVA